MAAIATGVEHVGVDETEVPAKLERMTAALEAEIVGEFVVVSGAIIRRRFAGPQISWNTDAWSSCEDRIGISENVQDADLLMVVCPVGKDRKIGVVVVQVAEPEVIDGTRAQDSVVVTSQRPRFQVEQTPARTVGKGWGSRGALVVQNIADIYVVVAAGVPVAANTDVVAVDGNASRFEPKVSSQNVVVIRRRP